MRDLLREQLITENVELVKYIVSRMAVELPASVDREDLVSTGIVGLIKAVDRFDPQRGVKFETYASCLIRGEIMESLRERDPVSRSLRRRMREVNRTVTELSTRLCRAPRAEEVAAAMGMTVGDYQIFLGHLRSAEVVSLEESIEADPQVEGRARLAEEPAPGQSGDPEAALEYKEFLESVSAGLEQLPEREQVVLALYYGQSLTLKEIGVIFGITESRVCQLHAQALRRLRAVLEEDDLALAA
jgi:RNA polymerase sigma factor for flagellar operon FliA